MTTLMILSRAFCIRARLRLMTFHDVGWGFGGHGDPSTSLPAHLVSIDRMSDVRIVLWILQVCSSHRQNNRSDVFIEKLIGLNATLRLHVKELNY